MAEVQQAQTITEYQLLCTEQRIADLGAAISGTHLTYTAEERHRMIQNQLNEAHVRKINLQERMKDRVVYKYEVPVSDEPIIEMPTGAQILHVGDQFGTMQLWALVNPDNKPVFRKLHVAGTGHPINNPDVNEETFIGTVMFVNDNLVFHVFDLGEHTKISEVKQIT